MKKSIATIAAVITLLCSATNIQANSIKTQTTTEDVVESSELQTVYDAYFIVKDALIKSDAKLTSAKAQDLLTAITAVKMDKLKSNEHTVWMKVVKKLTADAKSISTTSDLKKQRETFKSLSKNTYELVKVSKSTEVVYKQYCPMADADWLSKEKAVKNPYYGSSMLTCGNVVETIK
ncbi:MerP protein [Flavobacteriaceae bacterium CRH]|nr:MerP protein [Flavobacteriaceae bacterium CRH]